MKNKTLFTLLITLGLGLLLMAGFFGLPGQSFAQESSPTGPSSPQADVGTAFTYQGQLKNGSGPVNGTCDFRFNLYTDELSPTLVAGPVDRGNVTVSDGYFATSIDFGAGAFTGDGRRLQIAVRCPAGSGSYTTLSGMVMLSAAPYALSLMPGTTIASDSAGQLGSVLHVKDTYTGMLISAALEGKSTQGTGVRGQSASGNGVEGTSTSGYGVYGKATSPTGWAVYADGRGYVDDELYVNGKLYSDGNFHALSNAEVDGAVTVHGDLSWDAKTSYIAVAAAAFHPVVDGYYYSNQGHTLWNDDGDSDYYAAPIQLPHNATVTKLTFYWWDGSSVDGHCTLYRTDLTGGEVVMAEAWTSGNAATSDSSQDDTIVYATVDNSQYTYYLYWDLPDMVVAGYGVVIEYTITETY